MSSGYPRLACEYFQTRIPYHERTSQFFWLYDIEQEVFLHEGYHEPAVERS